MDSGAVGPWGATEATHRPQMDHLSVSKTLTCKCGVHGAKFLNSDHRLVWGIFSGGGIQIRGGQFRRSLAGWKPDTNDDEQAFCKQICEQMCVEDPIAQWK